MDPGTILVAALALILVAGYFVGGVINRRRAGALVAAIRDAFSSSPPGTLRWVGRNAFQIELRQPVAGLARLVASASLAPREAPLVWIFWAAVQGRGDLLDLKADLDAAPRGSGVAFDPHHRLGRAAARAAEAGGAQLADAGVGGLRIASHDADGLAMMRELVPVALRAGDVVLLEISAGRPRLELQLSLRGAPQESIGPLAAVLEGLIAATVP